MMTFIAWSISMAFFRAPDLSAALAVLKPALLDISSEPALILTSAPVGGFLVALASLAEINLTAYTQSYLLLLTAAGICWAMPNTQEFLCHYQPVMTADNMHIKRGSFTWRPTLRFSVLTALLLVISVLSLSSISRFIYFQF